MSVVLEHRSRANAWGCALLEERKTGLSAMAAERLSAATHWKYRVLLDLPSMRKTTCHVVQYSFAVALGLIYSQNVVSATLRALM